MAGLALLSFTTAYAQTVPVSTSHTYIPERAVVIHGDPTVADSSVIAVFYSREGLDFSDAGAPRFLLLDRRGKVAFGIGGSLYATASYDFKGAIDDYEFQPYDIAVPNNPELRQRFGAGAQNTSLFGKLVGRSEKLGIYSVYFQVKFTGNSGAYGVKLKQAYVNIAHFTAGLASSTFVDADAQAPTLDPFGAPGQVTEKNMLFRYTSPSYRGFKYALSVEVPKASYTNAERTDADGEETALSKAIPQRVPDIPAYVQYGWGDSHVRLSGMLRNLAYRDLLTGKNHIKTGWGVKLSTIINTGIFSPFGHVSYGKGISSYVNDISGEGFDLTPNPNRPGCLEATPSLTWTVGTYIYFKPNFFATASFSQARVYDCADMGDDTYKYGTYGCANIFYDFSSNFRLGAEYIHGTRCNFDGEKGTANRLSLLVQYSF